jgi:hypothetical protein
MGVDDAWWLLRYPPGTALLGALAVGVDDREATVEISHVRLGIHLIVWKWWRKIPSFLKFY